jgi:hypothetical protein
VILKGFKKCCTSNTVDENDDNVLCNDNEEVENASACDEGTDCKGGESDSDL